jgi:murein DD-endopeptidase MepM/ murein hydrolase activator NlpD
LRRSASKRAVATAQRGSNPSKDGFVWPVDGVITTYFGGKTPFQNFHTGLDIAGSAGDPVVATASGTITTATKMCCSDYASTVDKSYGYGNWIEMKHDNGYVSRYGHLMEFVVVPGQHVNRGQVIAYRGGALGMAGAGWSTGAHLHFEVWDAQGPFNPLDVLSD